MTATTTAKGPATVAKEQRQKKTRSKKRISPFQRPPSAFILFAKKRRPEIKNDNPDAKFGDISRMVGQDWKALPDHQKKPFEDEAIEAKVRAEQYNRKVREEHPELVEEYQAAKRRKVGSSNKSSNRGPNNFLLFSHSVRAQVKVEHPDKTPSELQRVIGKMWKELPVEKKNYWTLQWQQAKQAREAAVAVVANSTA